MDKKSDIEQFPVIFPVVCLLWADTYSVSDLTLQHYLDNKIEELIDSIPHISKEQSVEELLIKNLAIEELNFLIEMLKTNCRHNTYRVI